MRVPLSWLRSLVELPAEVTAADVAARLVRAGLEVERVESTGRDVTGPVLVGEVLAIEELSGFKKPIRWCQVDVGAGPRSIVCGATNFAVGDRVAVVLPGAVLPGGFAIAARETYGHTSDGMICSARELGLGDEHAGIMVLPPDTPVGADAVELLGLVDDVLDIAVTPDRGYALSIRGVAREAATAYGVTLRDPGLREVSAPGDGPPVRIDDATGCSRYVARVVTGLDPAAVSPLWLQRRLRLAGMRPISLAVDVTNSVLLETGQPLHAFDLSALSGEVVVRRALPAERLVTLDGQDRALDVDDLVIADSSGAVALAGVMGGASTEVTSSTTAVLVEAARFDQDTVARTARRHRLPSEASKRFERGVDPALAPAAADLAVDLLVRLGGATAGPQTDVDLRPPALEIRLDPALPALVAGRSYGAGVVGVRLADVGCAVDSDGETLLVTPPSWRPDLTEPVDLVEEVVRLEGYDTLPSVVPTAPAGRGLTAAQRARRVVGRALAEAGYAEVLAYPFVGEGALDDLGVPASDPRRAQVRLLNPVADSEPYLRSSLLPGLLATLVRNAGRGATDLALVETGLVFRDRGAGAAPRPAPRSRPSAGEVAAVDGALPDQPRHLAVALAGRRALPGWWGAGRPADWADAVAAVRTAADALGVTVELRAGDAMPWHPGRCAEVLVDGGVVGWAGELHPRVVGTLGLPARTCAAEVDLDVLVAAAPGAVPAPLVSPYPIAREDVALVVPAGVAAAAVEAALAAGAGDLLEGLRLFDLYTGPGLAEGTRSLAYALRFRAPDRTLTADEVAAARDAAVAAACERTGAVLRGPA